MGDPIPAMDHVKENAIELFVLKRNSFDGETQTAMERHIQSCSSCGAIEKFYRRFYGELMDASSPTRERLERFIGNDVFPRNVISLLPYQHQPGSELIGIENITVLAAQTPDVSSARFRPTAVLVSDEAGIVARVLLDSELDTYKLYIFAKDPATVRHATLFLPEFGVRVETDESGKGEFKLGEAIEASRWNSAKGLLRVQPK